MFKWCINVQMFKCFKTNVQSIQLPQPYSDYTGKEATVAGLKSFLYFHNFFLNWRPQPIFKSIFSFFIFPTQLI